MSKFIAKVVEVFPYDNCVSIETMDIYPRIMKYVPILLNGQPMPAVGDTVVIDDSIPQYPFIEGKYPIFNSPGSDASVEKQLSCMEYPRAPVQYGDINFSNEGDFVLKHRFTNTIIGLIKDLVIAKASRNAFVIFDKLEEALRGVIKNIDIKTGFGDFSINRFNDDEISLKISGKLYRGTEDYNIFLEAGTLGDKILKIEILSPLNDIVYSFIIYRDGNLSVTGGPAVFNFPTLAVLSETAALTIQRDINIDVKNKLSLNVNGNSDIEFNGPVNMFCGNSVNLGVANSVAATIGTLDLNITGRKIPLPTSPAATVGVSNGTLDFFVGDPTAGDSPSACSGINFFVGIPRQTRMPGLPYHFAVFSSTPGSIIIGGPPTMAPINSFVKFNEFAILAGGILAALTQIAAAFAAATDPALKTAAVSLSPNVAVLAPLIPTTMSLYVRTGEP